MAEDQPKAPGADVHGDDQLPSWLRDLRSQWKTEISSMPQQQQRWFHSRVVFPAARTSDSVTLVENSTPQADSALNSSPSNTLSKSVASERGIAPTIDVQLKRVFARPGTASPARMRSDAIARLRTFEADCRNALSSLRSDERQFRMAVSADIARFKRCGLRALVYLYAPLRFFVFQ